MCCHKLPCYSCGDKRQCLPNPKEWQTRSRTSFRKVYEGVYPHHVQAKRELYLQCNVFDVSQRVRRRDVADLTGGKALRPLLKEELADRERVPVMMRSIMDSCSVWKFEWMRDGSYSVTMGDGYKSNIIDGDVIRNCVYSYGVPPKLVDTMNCSNVDLVYIMWCETLNRPGQIVRRTDMVYWDSLCSAKSTMIEMVSEVDEEKGLMTLTRLVLMRG